jgi:HPt (histidine-containing phosphotransfer) domain-containing protein
VRACGHREDTWIDEVIVASYVRLFEAGHAHSVEVWREGALAGGLYGVSIGGVFFGESMFHRVTHASKVALAALVRILRSGGYALLDIQWTTPHLRSFGAIDIPRSQYCRLLAASLDLAAHFECSAGEKRFTPDVPTHHDRLMVGPHSPVNWEQLDMIADGYAEDFIEIYREFETDLPRIVGEVRQGLEAGDAAQAAHAAHQAKGSAANFGFFGFCSVMAAIEDAARIGNLTGLDAELAKAGALFQESLGLVKRERNI